MPMKGKISLKETQLTDRGRKKRTQEHKLWWGASSSLTVICSVSGKIQAGANSYKPLSVDSSVQKANVLASRGPAFQSAVSVVIGPIKSASKCSDPIGL